MRRPSPHSTATCARPSERLDSPDAPFLWVDTLPAEDRKTRTASLRQGGLVIEPLTTRERGGEIEIPDGIVHHWLGVVFAPGVSLNSAVALLQDYNRHEDIYKPNVAASKLLTRDGDHFKVALRFFMKKVITVVVNSDHDAQFTRDGPDARVESHPQHADRGSGKSRHAVRARAARRPRWRVSVAAEFVLAVSKSVMVVSTSSANRSR